MPVPTDSDDQPSIAMNSELRGDRTIDEMIGFLRGVMSDGELSDRKLLTLGRMIYERMADLDTHIFGELINSVATALRAFTNHTLDREILAATEREILKVLGTSINEITVRHSTAIPFTEPAPSIVIRDHVFCFTGKCSFGMRSQCEAAVTQRGGAVRDAPTTDTDYCVIGSLASRDWIHSTYGRKIERVLYLNSAYKPASIAIIDEDNFLRSIAEYDQAQSGAVTAKGQKGRPALYTEPLG